MTAPTNRRRNRLLPLLGLAGLTLLSCLAGFWLLFPTQALERRLNLEINRALKPLVPPGFPLEVRLEGVGRPGLLRLNARHLQVHLPANQLQLDRLQLRLPLTALLTGKPRLLLRGQLFGGPLQLQARPDGNISLQASAMQAVVQLPALPQLRLEVQLDNLHLQGQLQGQLLRTRQLNLTLTQLRLSGLEPLGGPAVPLELGRWQLNGQGSDSDTLQLQLDNPAGPLRLNGNARIQLTDNPQRSRLAGELQFGPLSDELAFARPLLSLLGQPASDGRYRLHLGGTLARPQLR
ncbi:type II secretion system protein GspN [Desulfuromonas thiophila]|uniref:type II secretion system protein GspN n=1 Tax=Desulfuromonas thiophila TaxID=57664 RepID=UPI0029F4CDE6|nr:type II secretion system protein GspN [Desulfuromonas thiophila]